MWHHGVVLLMKKFEFDAAENIFIKNLGGSLNNIDSYGFSREFKFTVAGELYKVVWYPNKSTLLYRGIRVMFHDVEITNTWPSPSGAKNKLQFNDVNGNVVSIIVLEWC
jgi:hypothetical protein